MSPKVRDLPEGIKLLQGAHTPDGKMCVMEAAAFVAGEPWSDAPKCVCPTIGTFLRSWNDALPDDDTRTRLLLPLLHDTLDTNTSKEDSIARSWMAYDWLVRTLAPAFLDLTPSLADHAARLRGLGPIVSLKTARAAETVTDAAWAAARAAARDAARDAAWDAAGDAAWDAAGAKLVPTVEAMQASAQDLVRRMCEVGR